jgi:hypothetical protein
VEFRLLFAGNLPSRGKAPEKHLIRQGFHPQLRELWRNDPNLKLLAAFKGVSGMKGHYSDAEHGDKVEEGWKALAVKRKDFNFLPLVTEAMDARCSLDIVLLRPGNGKLMTGGDIDNKLKTLFDALRMPELMQECDRITPGPDEDPMFVLLEDDSLITEVKVSTDNLLLLPNKREGV